MIEDGYDGFYADRLWALPPGVYRAMDTSGALRDIVNRIGAQMAVVRRSIDQLGADQSIETCDDWVIPYIGDLVATRILSWLPVAAQRTDVANTIYYRRRAGTLALLEELAANIAGRDARAVEFFRRLGRTRHQFDPEIGSVGAWDPAKPAPLAVSEGLAGAYTRTQAGGFADLRNVHGANNTDTAFDEYAHSADLRRPGGSLGWYGISRLGVFVWWLRSFAIAGATPVSNGAATPCFTFDPTGREIPLFAAARPATAFGENWVSPDEWSVPVAISEALWRSEPDKLYPDVPTADLPGAFWIGLLAGGTQARVSRTSLSIHPAMGQFSFPHGGVPGQIASNYRFGYASTIGAGGYDEGILPTLPQPATIVPVSGGLNALNQALTAHPPAAPGEMMRIDDSMTYTGPGPAVTVPNGTTLVLRAANEQRPVLRTTTANASWTLTGQAQSSGGAATVLTLQGIHVQGSDVVLAGTFDTVRLRMMTLDPGTSGAALTPPTLFMFAIDNLALRPVTLWIEGSVTTLILENCVTGPIRTRNGGSIANLTATDSVISSIPTHTGIATDPIFDPADLASRLKSRSDPLVTQVAAGLSAAAAALLNAYVIGQKPSDALVAAMTTALASVNRKTAEAAWPLALADLALGFSTGTVSLSRCTIIGHTVTHRLAASECILDGVARVEDPQQGCVRFTAYATGSNPHAPYRCVTIPPNAPLFMTRLFGRPDHARLRPDADNTILAPMVGDTILAGAANGGEMGAFGGELITLRQRGLAARFQEFMPIGQSPVWIDASLRPTGAGVGA